MGRSRDLADGTLAELNVDSNTLAVDSTNNRVGIGTASPAVTFDVSGYARASTGILFGTDTAAANALDDYEEGTWTPTIIGESGTINSYTINSATYRKVGDLVFVRVRFTVSDKGTGSNFNISNLPFSSSQQMLGQFSETASTGLTGVMFSSGTPSTSMTSRLYNWSGQCLVNGGYSVVCVYTNS